MTTPVKVGAFAAGLAAVFALAFGAGRVVDPDTTSDTAASAEHDAADHGAADHGATDHGATDHGATDHGATDHGATDHGATDHASEGATDEHAGHAAAGDLHLVLGQRSFAPGAAVPVSFRVQDPAGETVTSYDVAHEKELHLIVLGTRELTDFQHVHPTRAADGTWTVDLRLEPGTSYRLYADGSTGGEGFLATADVYTTGHHPAPGPVPVPATTDRVAGLTVDLDETDGAATLRVTRGGAPVELEPYLGALGHLVVIRVDDLSYLHVHPEEGDAPVFSVAGLAPGRYRYFFDFQVDGVVHTAAFTHEVTAGEDSRAMPMGTEEHDDH